MLMEKEIRSKSQKSEISLDWSLQLTASLAWIVSVFAYGSFALGDCLQLLAATAWTLSNIVSYFNHTSAPRV